MYLWQSKNRTYYFRLPSQPSWPWTKFQVLSVAFVIAYVSLAVSEPYLLFSAPQSAKLAMDKISGTISCILDSLCISGSLRTVLIIFGSPVSQTGHGQIAGTISCIRNSLCISGSLRTVLIIFGSPVSQTDQRQNCRYYQLHS